ncbi:MAG: acyl-CoA dehydrogenase family protein [Myxococcota bacterium]
MTQESFMKAVFHGVLAEELVLPFPEISSEERPILEGALDATRKFLHNYVDPVAIDREQRLSPAVLDGMREAGLFGLTIPPAFGGLGLSNTAFAQVMEEIAAVDGSVAVTLAAHHSIGLKGLLLFGTEWQKRRYLPRLASGELIAAFALSEPGAGSDAAGIHTTAELAEDGGGWVLHGSKVWVTNGEIAGLFTVFARTRPTEQEGKPRITAFLVERSHGVRHGPNEAKLGFRGTSTTALQFEHTRVPAGNMLGERGRGFRVAMDVLNNGRLSLAAGAVGSCKKLIRMAVSRCNERKAFGRPIGEFGMIREKIARMMCETWALESMTYLTTGLIDAGALDFSLESAICKVFGSESLWYVVNETLQIAAGIGCMADHPYERHLRDARTNLVFEGTNEILRAFIALAGMQSPGADLTEVAKAMREPIKGFGILSDFAVKQAKRSFRTNRLERVHPALKREAVLLEQTTSDLARETLRVLRKHGKEIAEMQFVQKRIADVAIDIYGLTATLSRATRDIERKGEEAARSEIELTMGFASIAERRLAKRLGEMEREEDELFKTVASKAYQERGYRFMIR